VALIPKRNPNPVQTPPLWDYLMVPPRPPKLKVVSLVPSWTETLIESGVEVVGRTRFCIHPKDRIKDIPAVGGTKDLHLQKLTLLNPDLVILDKEENTQEMAAQISAKIIATHVTSAETLIRELQSLGQALQTPALGMLAMEWQDLLKRPKPAPERVWQRLQELKVVQAISASKVSSSIAVWEEVGDRPWLYVIWRNPWMTVQRGVFISAIWEILGLQSRLVAGTSSLNFDNAAGSVDLYPKFDISQVPTDAVLLLSSEPYPFGKKLPELRDLGLSQFLVDGEAFSWFGVRSLRFLQSIFV